MSVQLFNIKIICPLQYKGKYILRIAFLTPWAIDNEKSWSGVVGPMYRSLKEHTDVVAIETGHVGISTIDRAVLATLGRVSRQQYLSGHAIASSIKRGRVVAGLIQEAQADLVLCVAASQDIAFADIEAPVVQVTDATFNAMQGYYPLFSNLHPLSVWQGREISRRSQARTAAFSVASHWARDALQKSGVSPEKCRVIPFGPAFQPASYLQRTRTSGLRVLVVASDWKRKGGDLAVAAVAAARLKFPDVSLTVVGNTPVLPAWVDSRGNVPRSEMPAIYAQHDVLLELAEANAGGVTLTDAHAYGLAVVATDTGGVDSIVAAGSSGILLDMREDLLLQATAALEKLNESNFYQRLAQGARERHVELLNWETWALETTRLCRETLPA